jgi:hypothetical protein
VPESVFVADGTELKLISGIDDCSRFCVIATVVRRATARAVMSYAGKIVTVICEKNSFRLVIDGDTVAEVPASPAGRSTVTRLMPPVPEAVNPCPK